MNLTKTSLWMLIAAILYGVWRTMDANLEKFYVFDQPTLHKVVLLAIEKHGNNTEALVDTIVSELHAIPSYKPHINLKQEWMFNNAGGAMGAMYIVHASITEYLIIFGTAIGTEGHTGRHTADDYFHVFKGTQLAYTPGSYEPEVYPEGSVHHLRRGEVKQYKMESGCFALEYARGWIPGMLGFGYADALTSTLDFPTLWTMTRVTGQQMVGNLLKGKF